MKRSALLTRKPWRPKRKIDPTWAPARAEATKRAGGLCQAHVIQVDCTGMGEHVHHRNQDRADNRPNNLLPLCAFCHDWVHTHIAASLKVGWLVSSWDDPDMVPVKRIYG